MWQRSTPGMFRSSSRRCALALSLAATCAEVIVQLQLAQYDAGEVASAMAELDGLSEEELLKLLAEEDGQGG